jgi:integrase
LLFSVSTPTVRRHFALLLKSLDLPQIHVHDIRHKTATISLESGVDVSIMLGNKDIATTERIYIDKTTKMPKRVTDGFLNAVK